MKRAVKTSTNPVARKFSSPDEIDVEIKKLRRRVVQLEQLEQLPAIDTSTDVETAESDIRRTILDVFGLDSLEYQEHEHHDIWAGVRYIGMSGAERERCVRAGIPRSKASLQGLIRRLEEEKEDLMSHTSAQPSLSSGEFSKKRSAEEIARALMSFTDCSRYLSNRRSDQTISLSSEAAVQDVVFLMLRPLVDDLVAETPTERVASRFTIKDFRSHSWRTIVETKFVRDAAHGRAISKELHDDIETYRSDPICGDLIFLVYDPNKHIPDTGALKRQIDVSREYDGRPFACRIIIAS